MNKTDEQLAREAKQAFDQSVDGLDAATLSRLNRGRQAALDEGRRSPAFAGRRWLPATGVAAAVLLVLVMQQGPSGVDVIAAPAPDLEILLSEESIEMLEELEFYSWLDTEELVDGGDLG
jgi:hypothetical protein